MSNEAKIASEIKTRAVFLNMASELGCKPDLIHIFNKYDKILLKCTNKTERKHLKVMAINEINNMFDSYTKMHYKLASKKEIEAANAEADIEKKPEVSVIKE